MNCDTTIALYIAGSSTQLQCLGHRPKVLLLARAHQRGENQSSSRVHARDARGHLHELSFKEGIPRHSLQDPALRWMSARRGIPSA